MFCLGLLQSTATIDPEHEAPVKAVKDDDDPMQAVFHSADTILQEDSSKNMIPKLHIMFIHFVQQLCSLAHCLLCSCFFQRLIRFQQGVQRYLLAAVHGVILHHLLAIGCIVCQSTFYI